MKELNQPKLGTKSGKYSKNILEYFLFPTGTNSPRSIAYWMDDSSDSHRRAMKARLADYCQLKLRSRLEWFVEFDCTTCV